MINIERLSNQVSELLHKDVAQQWRGVHLYMAKIRGEVGDVLDDCSELIESNTEMMFDDFLELYSLSGGYNDVIKSYYILAHYDMSEIDKYMSNTLKLCVFSYDEMSTMHTNIFKICRKVCESPLIWEGLEIGEHAYIDFIRGDWKVSDNLFLRLTFSVLMYIALSNELARIEEQAYIEGITLPSPTEIAPRLPHNERKEHEGTIIPPSEKSAQNENEGVILPPELNNTTAKKYFDRAIKYKVMGKNYKWLKTKALLAQFAFEMSMVLELNKAQSLDGQRYASWQPFEKLFEVKNLRGTYNDFKKTGDSPKEIELIHKIFGK